MQTRQHELVENLVGVIKYFYEITDNDNALQVNDRDTALRKKELERLSQEALQRIVNIAKELGKLKEPFFDRNIESLVNDIMELVNNTSPYTSKKPTLYEIGFQNLSNIVLNAREIIERDFANTPADQKSHAITPGSTPRSSGEYSSISDESTDEIIYPAGHPDKPAVLTLAFLGTNEHRTNPSILTVLNNAVRTGTHQSVHLIDGPGGDEANDKAHPRLGTYDHTSTYDPATGKIDVTKQQRKRGKVGAFSSRVAGQGMEDAVAETLSVVEAMMKAHKKPLIVNMAGFSRGADNALRAANELSARYSRDELIINFFSIDDVPGPYRNNRGGMTATRARLVPGIVKNYEAILMRNVEHNESRLSDKLRRVADSAFKVMDKAHLTFEDPSYTRQRYNLYQGTHSAPNYFYDPANPEKQINTVKQRAPQLAWDRLFNFMQAHGTRIDRKKIKYVAYLNKNEAQLANTESDASRLGHYSQMSLAHKKNDNGRSFTKYEADYFLHGRGYFQDVNHILLFQKFFPAFFDYFFQNNIDHAKWEDVVTDVKRMTKPSTEAEKSLLYDLGQENLWKHLSKYLGLLSPEVVIYRIPAPQPQGVYLAANNFYRHENQLFQLWNAMQAVLHPVMVGMDKSISRDAAKQIYENAVDILASKYSESDKFVAMLALASQEIVKLDKKPSEFTQRMTAMMMNFTNHEITNPAHGPHIYVREQLLKYIADNKPRKGEPGHDIQIAELIVSLLPAAEHTRNAAAFTPALLRYFLNEAQRHHQLLANRELDTSGKFDKQLRTILFNIPSERLTSAQLTNHALARHFNSQLHNLIASNYTTSSSESYTALSEETTDEENDDELPEYGVILDDPHGIFENANDEISLEQQEAKQIAREQGQQQTIQLNDKTKQSSGNPNPFPGYTFAKHKTTGANNPGPYGGVYTKDDDHSKAMFKCDTYNSDVRVAKTLSEFIVGAMLTQIMNEMHPEDKVDPRLKMSPNKFVAEVSLVHAAGSKQDVDVYLKSKYIKNRIDDLWLYAYKQIYTRQEYKKLTAKLPNLTADQKAQYTEKAQQLALERIKQRFGNSTDADKPLGFLKAFFRMKNSDIVKIPSQIILEQNHLTRQFCEMTVARIIMGDYGVHNYVMREDDHRTSLAAIDFGAGLLNLKNNVVFFDRIGTGAYFHKNHLLEYHPALYQSIDMAKAMINVATACLDNKFLESLAHNVIQSVDIPYTTDAIQKFCQRLGMDKKEYQHIKDKDQLVRIVADYVANKMTARCHSTLRQGYDLFLSHCFNNKSEIAFMDNPVLTRMLESNPDLRHFIRNELANYKCQFLPNNLKSTAIAALDAYERINALDKSKAAARLTHYLALTTELADKLQKIYTDIQSDIPVERFMATKLFIKMQDNYASEMEKLFAFFSEVRSRRDIDTTIPSIETKYNQYKTTIAEIDRLWAAIPAYVNKKIERQKAALVSATSRTPSNLRVSGQSLFTHESNDNDNNATSEPKQSTKSTVKPYNSGTHNDR